MFARYFFTLLMLTTSFAVFSSEDELSAYRTPNTSYESYEQAFLERERNSPFLAASAFTNARYYTGSNLRDATSWASVNSVNNLFTRVRDSRHIKWQRNPNFTRRISWLYPTDGCISRAAMTNRWFKKRGYAIPSKVFAFGKLRMNTRNHPRGYVTWWFHVAPIVQINGVKYVLDPSVDAGKPLLLRDWLDRMGTPSKIKVAICGSGTYGPKSSCSIDYVGTSGITSHNNYLNKEWDQLRI
jgi:hypothetical protein